MSDFSIAAAQITCVAGNIDVNIQRHSRAVALAAEHGVSLIIFPELSLTGYEPELARKLGLTLQDSRLELLRNQAKNHNITIVCGAPLCCNDGDALYIGAIVFAPDGTLYSYTKQHLHDTEEHFFTPGQGGPQLSLGERTLGLAICADIASPSHPQLAAAGGADIYGAGVLISKPSYDKESEMMRGYAEKHRMTVMLANHCAPTGGWIPAGKSAIWSELGHEIVVAPANQDALAIARKTHEGWHGHVELISYQGA
ncbi:carbon-nitrogen hydrolase family protein [Rouxiella badensis]|jgi:predicted amidohydrolase|uniref:carbon-nitrogen hydrolase family protein n=1 Tax=Rouxiella badensis TaxID=1646377 RepID=UPI0003773CAD|nr:carbon-nitrogen hydrolase family protein [Rouxiella badensis]QII37342.1 carbon-nitrogen hydrolase family protein [Rouxiella badensis]WAT11078.1 carbon-nitrogen hydrolase family protein [Rouxiella badensis]